MKTRKILGKLYDAAFPPEPKASSVWQDMQADLAANARGAKNHYAERLRPFVGRLVLVTDFPYAEAEHSKRIANDIRAAGFETDVPMDISAQILYQRTAVGKKRQKASASAMLFALHAAGFTEPIAPRIVHDSPEYWLRQLTLATEDTAIRFNARPHEIAHIAVVCATDTHNVDINYPHNAMAFRLASVGEPGPVDAKFKWETISVNELEANL